MDNEQNLRDTDLSKVIESENKGEMKLRGRQ